MSLISLNRTLGRSRWLFALAFAGILPSPAMAGEGEGHPVPGAIWAAPFALLLLAIAALPLIPRVEHWWEHNRSKFLVSLILGGIVVGYYATRAWGYHGSEPGVPTALAVAEHALLRDFLPFIALLFSLYVIAGGMALDGDLRARPAVNTGILALGACVASFVGTTGASMVLIRPLLQTNSERKHVRHTVIFFIFLVSNVGGCLLPIGDPPLFLGYLQGVPFLWTLRLVGPWMLAVVTLLVIYYLWDSYAYRREDRASLSSEESTFAPVRLRGTVNFLWLGLVVLALAVVVPGKAIPGTQIVPREYVREAILLGLAGLSLATTPRGLRARTGFTYGPILELICLFFGIFLTMPPAIEMLQAYGPRLGVDSPASFFWATGSLSSVLDNAPTYLVFLEAAKTLPLPDGVEAVTLLDGHAVAATRLAAVSLGAVFMGAMTYIGNGPNLMVRAIARDAGVEMPGFLGYCVYSLLVLLPVFFLVTRIFLV